MKFFGDVSRYCMESVLLFLFTAFAGKVSVQPCSVSIYPSVSNVSFEPTSVYP